MKALLVRFLLWSLWKLVDDPLSLFIQKVENSGVNLSSLNLSKVDDFGKWAPRVRALIARFDVDKENETMGQRNIHILNQLIRDYPNTAPASLNDLLQWVRRHS